MGENLLVLGSVSLKKVLVMAVSPSQPYGGLLCAIRSTRDCRGGKQEAKKKTNAPCASAPCTGHCGENQTPAFSHELAPLWTAGEENKEPKRRQTLPESRHHVEAAAGRTRPNLFP